MSRSKTIMEIRSIARGHTRTAINVVSANNFIKAGYRLFRPRHPWGWLNTLYWRRCLAGRKRG
ncbi:hypothetical protein [Bradyrhizobium sp.]|uniref:hypothetical protein n=1 Tax=Bradyrhizobium sp. TaxID=376 RepID=UPI00345D719D